jgi:transcriptional regulator with XRE-family HTH domain
MLQGATETTVAANVYRLRTTRGITLVGLAESVTARGHRMSETVVANIETGQRRIHVEDLVAFARVFGLSPEQLLADLTCETCHGKPPTGFTCRTCGTDAPAESRTGQ